MALKKTSGTRDAIYAERYLRGPKRHVCTFCEFSKIVRQNKT